MNTIASDATSSAGSADLEVGVQPVVVALVETITGGRTGGEMTGFAVETNGQNGELM